MPRRSTPDPLAARIGARIRTLRKEAGLTYRQLTDEIEPPPRRSKEAFFSPGYLSDIEKGLARPTVATLALIADRLGVRVFDLLVFPDQDDRQKLVDRTRRLPKGSIRKLLREITVDEKK